jgi:aldose 1-epimerase
MPQPHLNRTLFGRMPDGTAIDLFTLTNSHGVEIRAITYGCIIASIRVPDRTGRFDDIVLGQDTMEGYLTRSRFFGAVVGRYANRIAKGRFTLDGKTYQLATNNGPNHLHGGIRGFDKVVWAAEAHDQDGDASVIFKYTSADGEEGYPGALDVHVTYTLTPRNELVIVYEAWTDEPTVINLTQHSYFNLGGETSGDITGHELTIEADRFTPVDATQIPAGEISQVDGTPFDFRKATRIGARIDADDEQIRRGRGYDHNWVIRPSTGSGQAPSTGPGQAALTRSTLAPAARVAEPRTGRTLSVATTEPGLQFYAGNNLNGRLVGKGGRAYGKRSGLCLETQHFPDSPNHANFPSTVLRPGERFQSKTVFTFGVEG